MSQLTIVLLALTKLVASDFDKDLDERYKTLPRSEFVKYFNSQNQLWNVTEYPVAHHGMPIIPEIDGLGSVTYNLPIMMYDPALVGPLPLNFDARLKWPLCKTIGEIYNQHECQSCWAHGVANTASDRICIHNNIVYPTVRLSEQDLECGHDRTSICKPQNPIVGLVYWKTDGIVTRDCKFYNPLNVPIRQCQKTCDVRTGDNYLDLFKYYENKFKARSIYCLPPDSYQIKAELFLNGPIQAMMTLYEDFNDPDIRLGYRGGIYEYQRGKKIGYHSVRIIGYGVERGVEYWLVANSWGPGWGENGLFRIKSFQPAIGMEDHMCIGLPEPTP